MDGSPREGSDSYGIELLEELKTANGLGLAAAGILSLRLDHALGLNRYADGSAPLFADSFPLPVSADSHRPVPSWTRSGSTLIARFDTYELAVSLGSQGGRGFGGHGHLDAGSFELHHRDVGILVADPGCTGYGSGVTRTYERSYLSHNMATPLWRLADQPVWGSFAYRRTPQAGLRSVCLDPEGGIEIDLEVPQQNRQGTDSAIVRRRLFLDATGLRVHDLLCNISDPRPIVRTFLVAEVAHVEALGVVPLQSRSVTGSRLELLAHRSRNRWCMQRQRFDGLTDATTLDANPVRIALPAPVNRRTRGQQPS